MIESRRMRWAGHVACIEREEECVQGFGETTRRKTQIRRLRHGREDNIKIDLREVKWDGMDWIHPGQGSDQWGDLMNLRVQNVGKFLSSGSDC
jgi:hypothetical protein